MPVILDYQTPTPSRGYCEAFGVLVSVSAWLSAVVTVAWGVRLTERAQLALLVPYSCGTGRHEAEGMVYWGVPLGVLLTVALWVASRLLGHGQLVCRCASWAAVVGWLTCVCFVALI